MSIYRKLIFRFLFIYFSINLALSEEVAIVVDASGSMKGFFDTNSVQNYVNNICSKITTISYIKLFFFEKKLKPYENNPVQYGKTTHLDTAYENVLKNNYKIAIIITDNLQATKEESEDVLNFYDKLAEENVKKIYFVPKLLDFNGLILNKTYSIINKKNYEGNRGLLTYIILFDDNFNENYDEILTSFSDEELLLIKPITNEEINIIGVDENNLDDVTEAINNLVSKCPNFNTFERVKPNTKITDNGLLVPIDKNKPLILKYEQKNKVRFFFSLQSKLKHINIGTDENPCDDSIKMSVENQFARSKNKNLKIKNKNLSGNITPPNLIGTLEANKQSKYYYCVDIVIGPFKSNWGLDNFMDYIDWDFKKFWFKDYQLYINFDVQITVPSRYFTLTKLFKNRYFTDAENNFEKIYSPRDIVQYINTKEVNINLNVVSK